MPVSRERQSENAAWLGGELMAFFKETVGTVRLVLAISASWLLVANALALLLYPGDTVTAALSVIGFALGCFYLYVAARFATLLVSRPALIVNSLLAMVGLNVLNALLGLIFGLWGEAIRSIFGALIGWYLVSNVRRLASETRATRLQVSE